MLCVEISISRKPHVFRAKEVKIKQNQMNLKDAFWNWVVTHAQTIQNVDMHLKFGNASSQNEFRFNLFYDVWLRPPLSRYSNRTLKNCIKWMKTRSDSLVQLKSDRDSHWHFRIRQLFCHTSVFEHRHLKPD